MAYQFARITLYSRKGKAGRGTDYIFDEVSRRPSASLHVQNPLPPTVVFGESVERLRAIHDSKAVAARTIVSGKPKAIRKDQNTLVTVIVSHPSTVSECNDDLVTQLSVDDWEQRTVSWLISTYGDELVSVVRHMDESHPHLHAFLIPKDGQMRAGNLHPGFLAKNRMKAAGPAAEEDDKTFNKRADRAYVAAMQHWLDGFHQHVAMPCGLTRLGPGGRTLTRSAWQQEKKQAKALKTTIERANKVKADGQAYIVAVKNEAAKMIADAKKETARAIQAKTVAQEAERRSQEARKYAQQSQDQALAEIVRARKFGGWAASLRAVWDNLRKSQLVSKIRKELDEETTYWRTKAGQNEQRRLATDRQLHEAHSRVIEVRHEIAQALIERDYFRSMYRPADRGPTFVGPKLTLEMTSTPDSKTNIR